MAEEELSTTAATLLMHVYENVGESDFELRDDIARNWGMQSDDLKKALDELIKSKAIQKKAPLDDGWIVGLTAAGLESARSHIEFARALGQLRSKADSLSPAMRKDFDEIISEVERHLRQQAHNEPVLKLLVGGIADMFGSHIPEITTLLSLVGR